jgi:xanthine/uracil permease
VSHVPVQSVTTAPVSLHDEQRGRMRQYLLTMALRTVCFVGAYFFEGWLRWTCVLLAVVLPYIAVVLVNAVNPRDADPDASLRTSDAPRQLGPR